MQNVTIPRGQIGWGWTRNYRICQIKKTSGTSQTAFSEKWWGWVPDCCGLRHEWEVKTGLAACKLTLSRNMIVRGRGGRRPERRRWWQKGFLGG